MHPPPLSFLSSDLIPWAGVSLVGSGLSHFLGESPVMLQSAWAALKDEGREHLCPQKPGWLGRAG